MSVVTKIKSQNAQAPQKISALVTVANEFEEVPVFNRNMFAVVPGMPAATAISHAACIVDSLREMACEGVSDGGISERKAWLMDANLSIVFGLLTSIESAIEISEAAA